METNPGLRDSLMRLGGETLIAEMLRSAPPQVDEVEPLPLPLTQACLHAALSHTFTLAEIGDTSSDDSAALLANAATVTVGRRTRLRLYDGVRGRLIDALAGSELLAATLQAHRAEDDRAVRSAIATGSKDEDALASALLRLYLSEPAPLLETSSTIMWRAGAKACEALQQVRSRLFPARPTLDELRRGAELGEVLEPLRVLIGASGRSNDNRFVGRSDELRLLRSFVDELESQTAMEGFSRFAQRSSRMIKSFLTDTAPRLMMIIGRGGLGKSALMAKFVLDHALNQATRFPFAYLDFDRASLSPGNPLKLLADVERQLLLQFPSAPDRDPSPDSNSRPDRGATPFARIRALVRTILTETPGRTFLLVLDTIEVVQADPLAMKGIVEFLSLLEGRDFPELCVVAAGRAEVQEFHQEFESWTLKEHKLAPMGYEDALALVRRFGEHYLGSAWQKGWADQIVGRKSGPAVRREPLTLRLSVDLVRGTPTNERADLLRKIEIEGEEANDGFIGWLYEQRILSHIGDKDAQKLAWPGLVARSMSRRMAREVLAPLCNVMPDDIDRAFDCLGREVWIVTFDRDRDTLRHNPELRARTLPLMRRHSPDLFQKVARSVLHFYRIDQEGDRTANAAEIFYLRLLCGEEVTSVDRDWRDAFKLALSDAAADFPANGQVSCYLLERSASRLLPANVVKMLPEPIAWRHLVTHGSALAGLGDARIDRRLQHPRSAMYDEGDQSKGWELASSLLIKTGQWRSVPFAPPRHIDQPHAASVWAFFLARTRFDQVDHRDALDLIDRIVERATEGPKWMRALIHSLPLAVRCGIGDEVDGCLARLLERSAPRSIRTSSGMWTALAFASRSQASLLNAWVNRGRYGLQLSAVSKSQLKLLVNFCQAALDDARWATHDHDFLLREADAAIRNGKHDRPIRADSPRLMELVNWLFAWVGAETKEWSVARTFISEFFKYRRREWLCPLGYAIDAALPQRVIPADVIRRLQSYDSAKWWPGSTIKVPPDMIRLLSLADEADDLMEVLGLFLGSSADESEHMDNRLDLTFLAGQMDDWHKFVGSRF
ncbi:NACHT domain-containing protein [Asticcacaulis sp.]|uniref:NACHT domain-containing protein n=1 Tax=Asticcacaulis sp. TaxID=1872648 RepID=UPI0026155234|nr:NACHT domain-containing protein [Asticcacaulis sp.]